MRKRDGGRRASSTPRSAVGDLTRREKEVLRCLSEGMSTAAIAERLVISRATVRNHVQHILSKLRVHSKLAAVAEARRKNLT